jgi:hypothetical protein
MPQVVTHISDAWSFSELSDRAKERARDWFREGSDETDFECVIEDFTTICDIVGIDLATHQVQLMSGKTRSDPNIYYSVASCQGDGACFEGTYSHNGDSCAKIREHLSDEEVLRIVDELNSMQSGRVLRGLPTLEATLKHSGHYCHAHSVDFDVTVAGDDPDVDWSTVEADENTLIELMRDLMNWLYKQLQAEQDYRYSAEYVDEMMEANDYKFDEEGNRHAYA